tara:strand:- start:5012 stop:5176 length:165 start_codon:yes stop_codon:yes gene_type:complete
MYLEKVNQSKVGNQTLSMMLPHLEVIAKSYNLKLNRASDFKDAKTLLENSLINN